MLMNHQEQFIFVCANLSLFISIFLDQICHDQKQMSSVKVPGNVFICKILKKFKFKQRSFEVYIGIFFAHLILICCSYG